MSTLHPLAVTTLKVAKKAYGRLFDRSRGDTAKNFQPNAKASYLIKNGLLGNQPFMVARLGAVELSCVSNYRSIQNHKNNFMGYIKGDIDPFWWDEKICRNMSNNAGFFPADTSLMEQFAQLMIDNMRQVDVLGSWLWQERFFEQELAQAKKVSLFDLEPYNHQQPWSAALEGKKVLVIHPFVNSIRQQYERRSQLFPNPQILPEFELKTIQAVQSIANNYTGFKHWFEALDFMKDKIAATDFDIAIIGCGAYGFPLAAFVKQLGKKAVHLGGATQTLFGIKGKRWEEQKEHQIVAQMMNEHWIRPLLSETPQGIKNVEGGCYW